MMTLKPKTASYDDFMAKHLKDKEFAIGYLNECLQDEEDLTVFLIALRRVMDAQGAHMAKVSRKAGLNRESLYKMLSPKGNPELKSIQSLLNALGYKLAIQ